MSTIFPPTPLLLLPPRLRLMRLMSASLLVLLLSASLVLLMACIEVGAVILIVAKLFEVVAIYVAEVLPRRRVPLYVLTSRRWSGRCCRRRSMTSSVECLKGCNPLSQSGSGGFCRSLVEGNAK